MKDVGFGTWEAGESVTLSLESRNNQGKLFERIPEIGSIQLNVEFTIENGNMKLYCFYRIWEKIVYKLLVQILC